MLWIFTSHTATRRTKSRKIGESRRYLDNILVDEESVRNRTDLHKYVNPIHRGQSQGIIIIISTRSTCAVAVTHYEII